tara:strand:+ start:6186 stop:6677 length:492 start_codon:yes stop_codon:yes gene_type:complete
MIAIIIKEAEVKLTRRQLIDLINEAIDPVRVKTVKPEDYNPPQAFSSVSLGKPRELETPAKRVGNFFATRLPYKPPRGYSSLNKRKYFYMVLPDGEAINIDHRDIRINNQKLVNAYLTLLNQKVTPLPIEDIHQPTIEDEQNIQKMRSQIELVVNEFKATHDI